MQEIEQLALQTYQNNINFLKKYHNETYHKVDIFQNFVESGYKKEKYTLEYLPEGYFDVKELSSANFLYATDSIIFSKELTQKVNYSKTSYNFQGMQLFYNYEKAELSDTAQSHIGIYPIMSYYVEHYTDDLLMKNIEKFIFLGTGLGFHLEMIDAKIDAEKYIIIEDDLELFRLSLFTTPYYKFLQNKEVIFSIATNKQDFNHHFSDFLEVSFYLNRLIKYSYFPAHSDTKIQLIKNILASQNFLTFGYNTVLKKYLKPFDFLNQGYKVINLSIKHNLPSIQDKPVIVIGAGPSLEKNINWLQENQNKFIIYAVATSLKLLYKYNIKPDIVSHIDGFRAGYKNFENFEIQEFVKESIAILGSFVEQRVIDIFSKENVFMVEEDTFYFEGFSSVAAPCIGSTSVANTLYLGFKNIYLLGIDLALSSDGSTHYSGHESNNGKYHVQDKQEENEATISLRGDLFTVKGNIQESVQTTPLFNSSINSINYSIRQLKSDMQQILNLSEGAYIEGTLPTKIQDIQSLKELNKKELKRNLYREMAQVSKTQLSNNDVESLRKRLEYAQQAAIVIDNYNEKIDYTSINNYLYNMYGLIMQLYPKKTRENHNITSIFDSFFQYVIPLIYDMCNTKKDDKIILKDVEYIDQLMTKELKNITNQYTKKIEEFLKENY